MNGKSFKIENLIFIIVIALIILSFSLSFFLKEPKSFSQEENRSLQTFPSFTAEKLASGRYFEQLHDFYSDQMPLRNTMIEIKATTELLMGKNENNSIILGKDGYLIEKNEYSIENYEYLRDNLGKINSFADKFKNSSVIIIPRKIDILGDYLPPYYSTQRANIASSIVNDLGCISLEESLAYAQKQGTQVFYRTDHHWTAEGAYEAYRTLGETLGYTPKPMAYFNIGSVSNEFYGTTYSKSGMFFISPDTIRTPNREDNSLYITEIVDTGKSLEGFYDLSYLEKKDKYSLYISGNNAHVKVYDTRENDKETLLLVKDSFSHALVPYLAEHFDLEIIDLRYYTDSLSELISETEPDNILFIYGLDTIATAPISLR